MRFYVEPNGPMRRVEAMQLAKRDEEIRQLREQVEGLRASVLLLERACDYWIDLVKRQRPVHEWTAVDCGICGRRIRIQDVRQHVHDEHHEQYPHYIDVETGERA